MMPTRYPRSLTAPALALIIQFCVSGTGLAQGTDYTNFLKWRTVVNNNELIPGSTKNFNSYNQPSINSKGLVVFRARSKGPNTESGIFTRDMVGNWGMINKIADRATVVPAPNNTLYAPDNTLATFNEFPSIPRIAMNSLTIATRGNSQPTWTYVLPDLTETRVGTTGIFTNPAGTLITGASLLGAVPDPGSGVIGTDYFPYFQVPGAAAGTRFDVFPGSPAVTDDNIIVFKGNYTEGAIGKTGVFYRDVLASGGIDPVKLIANTSTVIPNLPAPVTGITFGSTAPPSAANGQMVFAGYDNEDNPTYGGIYLAPLSPAPALTTIVGIGSPVPNAPGETFTQFGEALSFDGRYVAFWGTWGTQTNHLVLDCPTDGNADLIAYCMQQYPNGFGVDIPVHQGIFVHDITTGVTTMVAQTGSGIDDFLYWTYSGKPPGVGGGDEGDGELPRWRSSAFVAVSGGHISGAETAFKARTGTIVSDHYDNPVDAIYWSHGSNLTVLIDTTTNGQSIDPEAPAGSVVSALTIKRESFRDKWLAISVSMLEPVSGESMAGIYVSGVAPLVVIVSGDSAPDATGSATIGEFDVLKRGGYLAENGNVVFPGFLLVGSGTPPVTTSPNTFMGLWKDDGSGIKLFARSGNDAPETGATAARFDVLPQTPAINDSGEVTFLASLAISGSSTPPTTVDNDTGLWSELGSTGLGILMREGDVIPGLGGPQIGSFASGCFATAHTGASTGEAAFCVTMKGSSTDTAVLRASVTGPTVTAVGVVARENSAMPGVAGELFGNLAGSYTDALRMDATGNLCFVALSKTNRESIWYQPNGGATTKVFIAGTAATGDVAPGTSGATFKSIKSPSIGGAGTISFRGFLNANGDNTGGKKGDGIWRGTPGGGFSCILRAGDDNTVRPGLGLPAGALVGNLWHGWLTNANHGAWRGWIDVNGNGVSSTADGDANAIYTDLSGTMKYVLKAGDPAPGISGATFVSFGLPIVGGAEQYAILANVTGGGTTAGNNWGIWRSAPGGGALSLVLRTGDLMTTTQGVKTIAKVDFPDSGATDRRWEQPVMDASGRLVIYVTFVGGSTCQVLAP